MAGSRLKTGQLKTGQLMTGQRAKPQRAGSNMNDFKWVRLLLVGSLLLLVAACSGSGAEPEEDCVADGSCTPGPNLEDSPQETSTELADPEGTYLGMPVGFTVDGFPYIGNPNAPVSLVEFTDYLCPFCLRHTAQTAPALLLEYGISGEVNFVFRDYPIEVLHPTAPDGHTASLCVAEQGAAQFWIYHDELFRSQDEWAGLEDPSEFLAQTATDIGADLTAYQECIDSGRTQQVVADRVAQAEMFGFDGTPSFKFVSNESNETYDLVGAQAVSLFQEWLDTLLEGEVPPGAVASTGLTSQEPTEVEASSFTVDPESQDTYQGMPVGFTEEGWPFIGSPDASVSLFEFTDYLCPFCQRHTTATTPPLLSEYVASGEVNFVFRDFPLAGLHPTAPTGHNASMCVAEQGAAFFWAFHDVLFLNQSQWAGLADPTAFLEQTAQEVGVDVDAYNSCISSGRNIPIIDARVAEGRALGFSGTPSFQFVNNDSSAVYDLVGALPIEQFQSYFDALLAGEAPPESAESEEQSSELPFWANSEGLVPDPNRPGYTLAGDPFKGDPDAPMVVVEFGDFQCPSCQRHNLEAQPTIDETFVDQGQIMWVFKNLPLQVHPQAPAAAVAAECAGDQGRFWEMDTLLYQTVDEWAIDDPDPELLRLARTLDIDQSEFASCLGSREPMERVLTDLFEARNVIDQTPSFVMIYGGQGRRLEGARSAEDFVAILTTQVESAIEIGR